jgi:hypothetical protein
LVLGNNRNPADIKLHGYVTDALTKKPVSGVLISVTATGGTGKMETTTDANGYFCFFQLPAAMVNLQFDKKGYQPHKRTGVAIRDKNPVKLNIEFIPESRVEDDLDETEYPILKIFEYD